MCEKNSVGELSLIPPRLALNNIVLNRLLKPGTALLLQQYVVNGSNIGGGDVAIAILVSIDDM